MSVFDYLSKSRAGKGNASNFMKDYAGDFMSKNAGPLDKPVSEQGKMAEWSKNIDRNNVGLTGKPIITQEEVDAKKAYEKADASSKEGMVENAPETEEEKAAREKRERNQRLINGIGTAINGVSGMIEGFTGGYAFPEEDKKEDPVEKSIDTAKQERLARAQRYYKFAEANNKALDDFIKAKKAIKDQKDKDRLAQLKLQMQLRDQSGKDKVRDAQADYWNNRARREGENADDQHDLNQSVIDKNNKTGDAAVTRANKTGTTSSSRGKANDPETRPFISNSRGRRTYFKTKDHQTKAYEAAMAFVPVQEPYYLKDRRGQWIRKMNPSQAVEHYSQTADSDANTNFWDCLEQYSDGGDTRSKAPWKSGQKPAPQNSGTSAKPKITL